MTAIASVLTGLVIIAIITDWVMNKNSPAIITGISTVVAKIIDVSLGKESA